MLLLLFLDSLGVTIGLSKKKKSLLITVNCTDFTLKLALISIIKEEAALLDGRRVEGKMKCDLSAPLLFKLTKCRGNAAGDQVPIPW